MKNPLFLSLLSLSLLLGVALSCKQDILTSYMLKGSTDPDQKNVLCPMIVNNCCSQVDQMKLHKYFEISFRNDIAAYHKKTAKAFAGLSSLFSEPDFDYTKPLKYFTDNYTVKEDVVKRLEGLKEKLNKLHKESVFKNVDALSKEAEGINKFIGDLRNGFLCAVCDADAHKFINYDAGSISLGRDFCDILSNKNNKVIDFLHSKYTIYLDAVLDYDEFLYTLTKQRIFASSEYRDNLKKTIQSLNDCKTPEKPTSCDAYCNQFKINSFSDLFDGEEKAFLDIATIYAEKSVLLTDEKNYLKFKNDGAKKKVVQVVQQVQQANNGVKIGPDGKPLPPDPVPAPGTDQLKLLDKDGKEVLVDGKPAVFNVLDASNAPILDSNKKTIPAYALDKNGKAILKDGKPIPTIVRGNDGKPLLRNGKVIFSIVLDRDYKAVLKADSTTTSAIVLDKAGKPVDDFDKLPMVSVVFGADGVAMLTAQGTPIPSVFFDSDGKVINYTNAKPTPSNLHSKKDTPIPTIVLNDDRTPVLVKGNVIPLYYQDDAAKILTGPSGFYIPAAMFGKDKKPVMDKDEAFNVFVIGANGKPEIGGDKLPKTKVVLDAQDQPVFDGDKPKLRDVQGSNTSTTKRRKLGLLRNMLKPHQRNLRQIYRHHRFNERNLGERYGRRQHYKARQHKKRQHRITRRSRTNRKLNTIQNGGNAPVKTDNPVTGVEPVKNNEGGANRGGEGGANRRSEGGAGRRNEGEAGTGQQGSGAKDKNNVFKPQHGQLKKLLENDADAKSVKSEAFKSFLSSRSVSDILTTTPMFKGVPVAEEANNKTGLYRLATKPKTISTLVNSVDVKGINLADYLKHDLSMVKDLLFDALFYKPKAKDIKAGLKLDDSVTARLEKTSRDQVSWFANDVNIRYKKFISKAKFIKADNEEVRRQIEKMRKPVATTGAGLESASRMGVMFAAVLVYFMTMAN